ncbi:natriuretic peptides A-like [Phaenicophaeus curvirostris]|uniref:natriuretic peptides A-like n=1 Tax=Phaenicophaeus curvirostris TaxID=33595 RepID=UPI0037F0A123
MQVPALCCGALVLLLVLPRAGAQPGDGGHSAELRSLQDLLEALGQLREEEEEPGLEDEAVAGDEDDGSEWDLSWAAPLPAPSPPQLAEGQSRWMSLLSSYRRRHFSGCFGMRMERIGTQTGLGCNQYKARRNSPIALRALGQWPSGPGTDANTRNAHNAHPLPPGSSSPTGLIHFPTRITE